MGTTGIYQYHGSIQDKINHITGGYPKHMEVLAARNVKSTIYAAMFDTQTGKTWCLVVPHFMRQGDWYYKEQSDDMGPYEAHCPESVLKHLGPPANQYAKEWREECRRNNARGIDKLVAGDVIDVGQNWPYTFGGERYEIRRFEFIKRFRFWALDEDHKRLFTVRMGKDWKKNSEITKVMEKDDLQALREEQREQEEARIIARFV